MADHIFGNVNWHMPSSIMDRDGVANHLGENCARPAPSPDDLFLAPLVQIFDFLQKFRADKWALLK